MCERKHLYENVVLARAAFDFTQPASDRVSHNAVLSAVRMRNDCAPCPGSRVSEGIQVSVVSFGPHLAVLMSSRDQLQALGWLQCLILALRIGF